MPRSVVFIAKCFFAAFLAVAIPCFAADTEATALEMVKKLRLGENLSVLGLQAVSNTQTYRIISNTVGSEKARLLVTEELNKAKPKYQDQWDRNLAASYSSLFTVEELQSIAKQQKQSPYIQKFLAKQNEVGAAMQSKSTGLLNDFAAEVLGNSFRRVTPSK